jgi:8-amino-7-oxononanoate synthase
MVVESIYSMDGDEAPLVDIVELAKKYNAHVIVDEAHSTGLLNNDGSGLCCQLGIEKEVFARVYTFGKAMGAHGAVVAGSEILKSYLINYSRQFIYTTSLPHHSIQTIIKAINYRKLNGELWKGLQDKIEKFRNQLNKEINLLQSNHPIQGVITGSSEKAILLANFLQEKRFDIRPIVSPTVPLHQERVRICLHAFNTDESIDELCRQLNQYYS